MKETIVYSNLLNQTELLRSLSLNGINSFNYRVYRFNDLLENAHLRLGAFMKGAGITTNDALFVLEGFITEIYPFSSFMDIRHIYNTLRDVRMNITDKDELAYFTNRVVSKLKDNQNVEILKKVFTRYLDELKKKSLYDNILLAREVIAKKQRLYNTIYILNEEVLSPLEIELLNTLGTIKKVSLVDLYHQTLKPNLIVDTIKPFYGEKSEIDGVLSDIAKNKYPLDTCLIVLAKKDKYVHLLNEDSEIYNIPITFECGLPIHLSTPHNLYQLLTLLNNKYFYDVNGYLRLLKSSCFKSTGLINSKYVDTTANLLGRWKINYDKSSNDLFLDNYRTMNPKYRETFLDKVNHSKDAIKVGEEDALKIIDIFSNGLPYILKNYTDIPDNNKRAFNETALEYILDTLKSIENFKNEAFIDTYLQEMNNRYLLGKAFKSGAIHVTTIEKALSTVRPHVYILGLSAENFPGKPKEDYLMNNEAYELLIGVKKKSDEKINQRRDYLINLINDYKSLGLEVNLSYSCKNIEDVKDVNPSSVVFEYAHNKGIILKNERKKTKQFDNEISSLRMMRKEFMEHKEIDINAPSMVQPLDPRNLADKSYSPSALTTFLKCKLRFYLANVLYADKPQEYDALTIFQGGVFGDLLHLVMETYANNQTKYSTQASFSNLVEEIFNAYIKFNVPLVKPTDQYSDFVISCLNAYNIVKKYELVGAEVAIKDQDINGVKFHSSIDLVAKVPNTNEYIIFDYKTARSTEHANNDFNKDIQGIVYAYLLEKEKHIKVKRVSFIYTRYNNVYSYDNPFNDDTKDKLNNLIAEFNDAITSKSFLIPQFVNDDDENERCKYCNFASMCHKDDKKI